MSYCRFGWDNSNVYLFESSEGFECCGCWLNKISQTFETRQDLISHLMIHLQEGHIVPRYAIDALLNEIYEPIEPQPKPEFQKKIKAQFEEAKKEK